MMFDAKVISDAAEAGIRIGEFCEKALIDEVDRLKQVAAIDSAKEVSCAKCGAKFSDLCWKKRPELEGKCISCGASI